MRDVELLRAACAQQLREVPIPEPFDLLRYCQAVAEYRRRPLRLFETTALSADEDHPFGVWLEFEAEDRIYTAQSASPLHRVHIALHEIGHMLGRHDTGAVLVDDATASRLAPDLGAETLLRMFGRGTFSTQQEREAEMFASMMLERIGLLPMAIPAARHRGLVDRLAESLGHPLRPGETP
jgi:hypothetical protein